jgi:translocator protein
MDRDLRRQAVNVVSYVLTVIVNGLAVALPLNGLETGEISDRFPVLVTPAGYVFSIWSLIYLLLAAFTLYQALPGKRQQPELRAIGYLPALAGLLNAAWVLLWHYEVFALTVPVMLALLGTLVLIHRRLRPTRRAGGAARWVVALPFSVYLGWITVATIANISQMLYRAGYRGEPLGEELWALIILAAGVGITAIMLLRELDWAYALVIIWAYVGIAAEQEALLAVVTSLAGAAAVGALVAYVLLRQIQGSASSGATPA